MNRWPILPPNHARGPRKAWRRRGFIGPALALTVTLLVTESVVGTASAASCAASQLDLGARVTVEAITPEGTLIAAKGLEIRLAGIAAPRPKHGHEAAQPLADVARRELAALTVGKSLVLYQGSKRRDRYDRALAHPCLDDGTWIQQWMLERGFALVASTRDTARLAGEMLAVEKQARNQKRGIWAERFFRIRNPHETRRDIDTYQIVEGRVVSAAIIKGRAYLNFGQDWRTDFTFSIAPRDRRRFERTGIDLAALGARRVRGRGWVTLRNGPLIELTHPEQLEVLGE
jgi:micrococcal nuclease